VTRITSIEWSTKGIGKECTIKCNDGWTHVGWGYDSKEASTKAINEMLARVQADPAELDSKMRAAGEGQP